MTVALSAITVRPIGVVRAPLTEKARAPRQPTPGITGFIDVLPEHADALDDLAGFSRIWVIFWFHEAAPRTGKVAPPRSATRRGVFATRAPHRPNPIGLSALRLLGVDALRLTVADLDMLDGTPVLDVKPYLAYADAFPDASAGWLDGQDPLPAWRVVFAPAAAAALAWLEARDPASTLRARLEESLALGPAPRAYRRIRETPDGPVIAVKDWRARLSAGDHTVVVREIFSGYRPSELARGQSEQHALHRAFTATFG